MKSAEYPVLIDRLYECSKRVDGVPIYASERYVFLARLSANIISIRYAMMWQPQLSTVSDSLHRTRRRFAENYEVRVMQVHRVLQLPCIAGIRLHIYYNMSSLDDEN